MALRSYVVLPIFLATLLGASSSHNLPQNANDASECIAARCDTLDEINKLWCHEDPRFFCVCRPLTETSWELQPMPCAPETQFSFVHQKCVAHLEEPDRAACYYADTPGDGSGSGSGDDALWSIPAGGEVMFGEEDRFEGALDDLVEDDVMEFLFPGRLQ
ncbi:hypothetical protein quinque_002885 [Culex quinquefasciatus]|uniref:uncharacterized protein LOC119770054 n=1 Tax=Culex quinquefasciatus TaxID=7176 RepID=UPI0018E3B76E|nr:uncharacterized protein LOC119770054 [Culex quinquefasciatus]XP_039431812.1 uncharacterized protein LOC120414642 [Culex pipiens pallens]